MSAPELIHATKLSKASVATGLSNLERLRVIRSSGSYRTRLYQLNTNHLLHNAIQELFRTEEENYNHLMDEIRNVANNITPQLLGLWIYGSVARGEDNIGSDLDLCLINNEDQFKEGEKEFRLRLLDTGIENGVTISIVSVSSSELIAMYQARDVWLANILKDARSLLGAHPPSLVKHLILKAGFDLKAQPYIENTLDT